ncbi:unnamed protein product [marine sediment metagenome]|uniref:Uncharacterized protein n=1 Tax=marine sediment metagenome TaxID=412755 RepID=X1PVA5_9ZZZZ
MSNGNKDGKTALAVGAIGMSTVALIAALRKPAKAAPPENGIPPVIIAVLDEETRQALAMIISQQADTLSAINTANLTLTAISEALGAEPPVIEERILEPFKYENEALQKGVPFAVHESKPGKGSLIWAIFDVSDPNTKLSFRIDDLVWNFNFNTLLTQGVQQPLFPGVWLSKADAIAGHYCIIFSAGTIEGFVYKQRLIISLTLEGAGTATLHEARGIKWTYL